MKLHIIYTEHYIILSKKAYSSWREIQDEYSDYKTSLGPWEEDDVIDYLEKEYSNLEPDAKIQVGSIVKSQNETQVLKFI